MQQLKKYKNHTFPTYTSHVTKHQLHFFAKAIGETNPIYTKETAAKKAGYARLPAPPTFGFSLSIDTPVTFDYVLEMGIPLSNLLHGEQRFEYVQPILAGDTISFERTITDVYEKKQGALVFIQDALILTNQKGIVVGKMYGTMVFVKTIHKPSQKVKKEIVTSPTPTIINPAQLYQKLPNRKAIAVGYQMPVLVKAPINRTTLALFAGASNDHNPIHIDVDFAQQAGYPDVFAHGMLVMAYMGQAVTNWLPPNRLISFSARFKAITQLGDVLSCSGVVAEKNKDTIQLTLSVQDQWGEEKLSGSALVHFLE